MRIVRLGVVVALSCLGTVENARAQTQSTPPEASATPDPPAAPPEGVSPDAPDLAAGNLTPPKPLVAKRTAAPTPGSAPTEAEPSPAPAPTPPVATPPAPTTPNSPTPTHGGKVFAGVAPASVHAASDSPLPKATDAESDTPEQKDFKPFTLAFEIEGGLGANGRIDGGPSGFADKQRFDMALSLGAWAEPSRTWAYGLEYARTGLGGARTQPTPDSVTVAYDLNTLWAKARYFALREPKYRAYAGLGLGLSIEEVRANGTRESSMPFNVPPRVFACSAVSQPTVSLGAAAGVDVDLEQHLAFLFQVEAAAQPITGDVVGDCAVASGSVVNAVARLGFAYKFDAADSFIDEEPARNSARR